METEKVNIMKKDIKKGNYLKSNLLLQFGPVDENEKLETFLEYKSNKGRWKRKDCDVSYAAVLHYCMMYDFLHEDNISNQDGNEEKYEIVNETMKYRGDTITSAFTVFRKYLFYLWNDKNVSKEYRKCFEIDKQNTLYFSSDEFNYEEETFKEMICKNIEEEKEEDKEKREEFVKILKKELSNSAISFLDNYLKIGNMLPIPMNFNCERSNYGKWDTADHFLWKVYQYFGNESNEKKNEEYLSEMFTKNKEEAVANVLKWFTDAGIDSWESFVSINTFESMVDISDSMRPISFKTGHPINLDISEEYWPMPESLVECECFFGNANSAILERTIAIWCRIQGKSNDDI